MKRILGIILCLALAASLFVGCNNNGNSDNTTTQATTAEGESTTAAADDDSKYDLTRILDTDYSEYIVLGQYKGVEIDTSSDEYQEARTAFIQNALMNGGYVTEYENRAIEDGDTVNVDYVGYVDGEAFEGGDTKGNGANLTIGSHQYIDTFEEQLIGHMPGDEVEVVVTFPDPYPNDETMSGKEATFEVTINYIASAPIYPELSENLDIVKEYFECETMEEFEDMLCENLAPQIAMQKVLDDTRVISYPEKRIEEMTAEYTSMYESYASMYGVTVEELLAASGIDLSEMVEQSAKAEMVFVEILRAEGRNYTEEEYDEIFEDYAVEINYESLDDLLEAVSGSYTSDAHAKYDLALYLIQQEAQDIIVDNLVIINE